MSKKKKPVDWRARAGKLSTYGYSFPKRLDKRTRRRISTAWNKHGNWLHSKTPDRVQFIKGKPKPGLIFPSQKTPTGFFVKRPKNVDKKEYSIRVTKTGEVKYRIKARNEIIVSLRKRGLADDPKKEIERAIGKRRPCKVRLFIDGFDGKEMMDPREFSYYMLNLWLPERDEDIPAIKLKLIYNDQPLSARRGAARSKNKTRKTVRGHRH
jgi:hypothetical protein